MDVVIMAGGRGRRLGGVEKPLLSIRGRRLLDITVGAAEESGIGPVIVAVSRHTPRTAAYAASQGYAKVETSGKGYHEDLEELLQTRYPFLSMAVDLPFIRGRHISDLARAYRGVSVAGALPLHLVPAELELPDVGGEEWKDRIPVGINVVDRTERCDVFLFDDPLLAYNVNTQEDLERAEVKAHELDSPSRRLM